MMKLMLGLLSFCLYVSSGTAVAQDSVPNSSVKVLEVPAPDSLSAGDREQIEKAIKKGYGNVELKFVPESPAAEAKGFGICKPACATAYTGAGAACMLLSGPLIPVCLAAAALANQQCLKRCES